MFETFAVAGCVTSISPFKVHLHHGLSDASDSVVVALFTFARTSRPLYAQTFLFQRRPIPCELALLLFRLVFAYCRLRSIFHLAYALLPLVAG